jgi:amino acid transporter
MYALGRNHILPRAFGRTHPVHKTPHVAIVAQTIFGLAVALLLGWKYGDLITAFTIIATAVTIVVIVVYIIVCLSTIVYFARRPERTPWLHWLVPIFGAVVFIPPLYYQYFPLPPYPLRYAVWIALGWLVAGVVVAAFLPRRIVDNVDRVFVHEAP